MIFEVKKENGAIRLVPDSDSQWREAKTVEERDQIFKAEIHTTVKSLAISFHKFVMENNLYEGLSLDLAYEWFITGKKP